MDNLWSDARKESVDCAEWAESGRVFQSTTVLGKYEYLQTFIMLALRVALNTASRPVLCLTALAETAIAPTPEVALPPFLLTSKSIVVHIQKYYRCLLYTSPSPRDRQKSRMPSSA